MKFRAHETFFIRKGWINKGLRGVDKDGNINCLIGRVSFDAKTLEENFNALYQTILKARPAAVKGAYVLGVTLSSNMGPGVKVDVLGN